MRVLFIAAALLTACTQPSPEYIPPWALPLLADMAVSPDGYSWPNDPDMTVVPDLAPAPPDFYSCQSNKTEDGGWCCVERHWGCKQDSDCCAFYTPHFVGDMKAEGRCVEVGAPWGKICCDSVPSVNECAP
jgi:hypothetical protein